MVVKKENATAAYRKTETLPKSYRGLYTFFTCSEAAKVCPWQRCRWLSTNLTGCLDNPVQVRWAIGNGRLNTSPKLGAYTSIPSTPSSMAALLLTEGCLFSGKASSLDAFRTYPKKLSCSACPVGQLINQRLRRPVPLVLGATSPQTTTPLSGRDRPVSRRSKPSSRSPLMGEQPHPWLLLQNQDGKSRHRGTKPRGRWELSPATSLLSLG